ncbi:MAG: hypothetical protein GX053_12910 [Tissierella sp.]|nr:hypothetical protein [Tissierella sp.]
MDVNKINKITSTNYSYDRKDYAIEKASSKYEIKPPASEVDVYIPDSKTSNSDVGKTYTRDAATIDRLKLEADRQTQQLRDIVEKLILEQGDKFRESGMIEVDKETRLKAQEAISEDGYWGVKQTSQRLFDFAIGLTGGDPAKAQSMKDAFIKGFKKAKEAWGGQLPEISNQTYDATIKMFDQWIAENE